MDTLKSLDTKIQPFVPEIEEREKVICEWVDATTSIYGFRPLQQLIGHVYFTMGYANVMLN